MSCAPSRLLANQLNAQRSTGPRTDSGKRRACMNSRTHGFYCSDAVVAGESQLEFDAFRESFLLQFAPQDPVELLIVDEIVLSHWKLRRMRRSEFAFYDSEVDALREQMRDSLENGDLDGLCDANGTVNNPYVAGIAMMADVREPHSIIERYSRLQQRLMNNIYRAMRELRTLRKMKEKEPDLPASPYLDPERMAEAKAAEAELQAEWQADGQARMQASSRKYWMNEAAEAGHVNDAQPEVPGAQRSELRSEPKPEADFQPKHGREDANLRSEPTASTAERAPSADSTRDS